MKGEIRREAPEILNGAPLPSARAIATPERKQDGAHTSTSCWPWWLRPEMDDP